MTATMDETYARVERDIRDAIRQGGDLDGLYQLVCDRLNAELSTHNWVGI